MSITREEAWNLLNEFNKEPFHIRHAEVVEGIMKYFARELGYGEEEEFWGIVGLLHDLDFEQYPEQHCIKEQEIMKERGIDERIIHAVASHGYGLVADIKPEHEMEKVLFAGEVMPVRQLNYWMDKLSDAIFANLFGPTETTDICTYYVVDRKSVV